MIALAITGAACNQRPDEAARSAPVGSAPCTPIETRAPNAPDQRPAFPGQTYQSR